MCRRKLFCRVLIGLRFNRQFFVGLRVYFNFCCGRFPCRRKLFCCVRIALQFDKTFLSLFVKDCGLISNEIFRFPPVCVLTEIILSCIDQVSCTMEFFLSGSGFAAIWLQMKFSGSGWVQDVTWKKS